MVYGLKDIKQAVLSEALNTASFCFVTGLNNINTIIKRYVAIFIRRTETQRIITLKETVSVAAFAGKIIAKMAHARL